MLLHNFEIKFIKSGFTKQKIQDIKDIDLPENTRFSLDQYIEQFELLLKQANLLTSKAHSAIMNSKYANSHNLRQSP